MAAPRHAIPLVVAACLVAALAIAEPGDEPAAASLATAQATPNWEVFSVSVRSTRRRNLTRNRLRDVAPALSPAGRTLAFRREFTELWTMRTDGSSQRPLANRSEPISTRLAWSPDGTRIALSILGRDNEASAVIVTVPGGHQRTLENAFYPTWSPDGARIAFLSDPSPHYRVGAETIAVANADGTSRRAVVRNSAGFNYPPIWSPRGALLAVPRYSDSRFVIDVLDVETAATTRFGDGYHPAWSPDGKRLAFTDGNVVKVANISRPRPKRIVGGNGISFPHKPSWSPDGRWIACVTNTALVVVRATGGGVRILARNVRPGAGAPQWSRDGKTIFYEGTT